MRQEKKREVEKMRLENIREYEKVEKEIFDRRLKKDGRNQKRNPYGGNGLCFEIDLPLPNGK